MKRDTTVAGNSEKRAFQMLFTYNKLILGEFNGIAELTIRDNF